MEEDKKKKKPKKRKNKQATKPTEIVTNDARESSSDNQIHVEEIVQDENGQVSGTIDAPNDAGGITDTDRDGHLANGTEGTNLAKAEKHYWLEREASFQEKIKELQAEKDAQIQKEAILEEKIKQLLKEKDENLQKEANQNEKLKQLHDEKSASMQKEASLKEELIQLEKEKDALIQKEGLVQQKIEQLQREKDAYLQKEVSLQEKIKQMETERDSWILKENSAKESIASLKNDSIKLRAQVVELEQSRESLLEEKQQLTENISSLLMQINNLEATAGFPRSWMENKVTSEDGDLNYQIEAAQALVEKLITENSELVEKVKGLYAELDQRGVKTEYIFSVGSGPGDLTAQSADIADNSALRSDLSVGADDRHVIALATDSISEASKVMAVSGSTQSLEDVMIEYQRNGEHVNDNDGSTLANSSEIIEVDEIVQIPLDENEVEESNLEVAQNDEKTDVPLTDAPLIGAPFRLISFVARYVSGADLVNKNAGTPG